MESKRFVLKHILANRFAGPGVGPQAERSLGRIPGPGVGNRVVNSNIQ